MFQQKNIKMQKPFVPRTSDMSHSSSQRTITSKCINILHYLQRF